MIKIIDNSVHENAEQLRELFLKSYAVEAKILKADYFPPLLRTLDEFIDCPSIFLANSEDDILNGALELKQNDTHHHIQSLVVHPDHFRKGIGRQLVEYVLKQYPHSKYIVETGLDNKPAIALYEKCGFVENGTYTTPYSISKIKMKIE